MKKVVTRMVAYLLSISLIICLLPIISLSDDEECLFPMQDMLNAMLYGERSWVLDTLVEDNRESNPMAKLRYRSGEKSLAREALDTYYNIDGSAETSEAIYWNMVDIMEKVYNADEYVNTLVDELGNVVQWVAGLFSSSQKIHDFIDSLTMSKDELSYDKLLKSIFTEKYTASDGSTIQDVEETVQLIKEVKNVSDYFKKLNSFIKSYTGSLIGTEPEKMFEAEYVNNYVKPFSTAADDYLESFAKLNGSKDKETPAKDLAKMASVDLLAVLTYMNVQPKKEYEDFSYSQYMADYYDEIGLNDLLKYNGKALSYEDTALDTLIYVQSIQQQRDTVLGPIERIANHTADKDIKNSIKNFNRLIDEKYDTSFLSWDSVRTYYRNNNSSAKFISEKLTKSLKDHFYIANEYSFATAVVEGIAVVGISSWVADRVTGLEETCKKTYELLYWEDLAELCVNVYRDDLNEYKRTPSEETAKKVIDDLLLLQKIRLYGEKIACDLNSSPADSYLGKIYGGDELTSYWETVYQYSVDELIAASVMAPVKGISVPSGKTMIINYRDDIGYYGQMDGAYIIELPMKLSIGLSVNGTLIMNNPEDVKLGIGFIEAGDGANIGVLNGSVFLGELNQTVGTINIITRNDSTITITKNLAVNNVLYESDNESTIFAENLYINGTVDAPLSISGDIESNSGSVKFIKFIGDKPQNITGSLTVTDTLYCGSERITNGDRIIFSGNRIIGGIWKGNLSVRNASINTVRVLGTLYDLGGSIYRDDITVEGRYLVQGNSTIIGSGTVNAYGLATISANMDGGGALKLYSDLYVTNNPNLQCSMTFAGELPQEVTGSFSADNLYFSNASKNGVSVSGTCTVNKTLSNPRGKVSLSTPIKLGENATLNSNFMGSVSVLKWNVKPNTVIAGNLIIQNEGRLSGGPLTIKGSAELSGTGVLDGINVTTSAFRSNTSLAIQNNAELTVNGKGILGGKLIAETEPVFYGDLELNSLTAEGTINAKGDVIVSGTTTLDGLKIDGFLRQEISGSSFAVNNLSINNTSKYPVRLSQTVSVAGVYSNSSRPVSGGTIRSALKASDGVTQNTHITTNVVLSEPLIISDCIMEIDGNLSATNISLQNAELIVHGNTTVTSITLDNSKLQINGNTTVGGGTTSVSSGSKLLIRGWLNSTSGEMNLDGELEVRGDLFANSTSLNGGVLIIGGDLSGSGEIRPDKCILNGLTRQRIEAAKVYTRVIELNNQCKGGVILQSTVRYSDTFDNNGTALFNETNLIKEAT